jgi:xylulokinase
MYLLAFDIGTSALKTTVLTQQGHVAASAGFAYPTRTDAAGAAEQDPGLWWQGVCQTSRHLVECHPEIMRQIAAIGVSGHMLGCLPLDSGGNPVRPAMIHSDRRAVDAFRQIEQVIGKDPLYRLTGNVLDPRSSLCKVLWLKLNQPEQYASTARFVQSKDYVVSKLTGCLDVTDFSDASHAQWIDISKKTYLHDVFSELGIDSGKFPALHRGTDVVGRTTETAAAQTGLMQGIPVVAGGGDGACANVAAGLTRPGDIYCSLGTTAWISRNVSQPLFDNQQRVFNIMSLDGENCGVFGTMQNAGKAIEWALGAFDFVDPKELDTAASGIEAGSGGLTFLPYLDGERTPVFDANARGVFFNIGSMHRRAHFARAVLEGTGYALRSILEIFRDHAQEKSPPGVDDSDIINEMRLIGGGARSDLWCQILADVMNVRLRALNIPAGDATSTGAAFAAGVGVGLYASLADAASSVRADRLIEPQPGLQGVYGSGFALYQKIYPHLKDLFQDI